MIPRVAVLGCGPSGLVAAHAAKMAGATVEIFSTKIKSALYGAQYLHAPIPLISNYEASVPIQYKLMGSAEDYRRKVYGDRVVQVSPNQLGEDHLAWDIRDAYDRLWALYEHQIFNSKIDYYTVRDVILIGNWDRIYSSIPAPAICGRPGTHKFEHAVVWANGDAPDLGHFVPEAFTDLGADIIICDGTNRNSWYRYSNVFGHRTIEWPENHGNQASFYAASVRKPISNDCRCWMAEPRIKRVGRYGAWRKGILVHEVFDWVSRDLAEL